MDFISKYSSPIGEITLASNGDALTGLWLEGQKYCGAPLSVSSQEADFPIFTQTKEWLDCYFNGVDPAFTPPLHLEGTSFRLEVWEILKSIPYGEVISYKEIANRIAKQRGVQRMSSQAIGGAVGHNPISIIIPCHRVIGSKGDLVGYAGGIHLKAELLKLEKAKTDSLFVLK